MAEEHIQAAPPNEAAPPPPADGQPALPVGEKAYDEAISPQPTTPAVATAAPAVVTTDLGKPETKKASTSATEPKDVAREIAETVVFVIVLVLLLKTFIAEAFVIPTGSMATTLWGYQKVVECNQCGYVFPVNCSVQVDPASVHHSNVMGCVCPNCQLNITFPNENSPPWNSGDRVLVFKAWFDSGLPGGKAKRHDVVVFKFPVEPQKDGQAMNYIKRLIGLPGETIAISGGQLYVLSGPRANPPPPPQDPITGEPIYFAFSYNWPDDREAENLFKTGKFTIIRKAPDKMMALRRIVFDNDFLPLDLKGPDKARWQPDGGWKPDNPDLAKSFGHTGAELSWLRYRHLQRGNDRPSLILDMMGYNTGKPPDNRDALGSHWVGDLMVECEVQVDQAQGEFWLELSRASDRFQARFNLADGKCQLVRLPKGGAEKVLSTADTTVKGPGKYQITLANFDERLTLWVNDSLPFGDGVEYPAASEAGPDNDNDLQPASIAAKGASLSVSHLKLWRDTYYTTGQGEAPVRTFYIYPGHFLCMGDNSPQSSDGRMWGMVPERLMLGRALMVYFPFKFDYWPLKLPANRVGTIH